MYVHIFSNLKVPKSLNSEHFGKSFEILVTLISKWPGISKIYPPILDYKMLCVLSNDLLVFDSSHGTPCILINYLFINIFRGGSLSRSGSVTQSVTESVCHILVKLDKEGIGESRKSPL